MNLAATLQQLALEAASKSKKPEWSKQSPKHELLDRMHNDLTGLGYKHTGSRFEDSSTVVHHYSKSSKEGKESKSRIIEKADGTHSTAEK